MSDIVHCPRCRAPNDPAFAVDGILTCGVCRHLWNPATDRTASGEYLPGESERTPVRPLTERKDAIVEGITFDSGLLDRLETEAGSAGPAPSKVPAAAMVHGAPACPVCGADLPPGDGPLVCGECGSAHAPGSDRIVAGQASRDPLIGRTLSGCRLDRKLGEGGMGAVYHATQLSLDRSVAVKILPPELARNRNFITRFEREAKSLARINHPNILQIYDFGDDPQFGLYYMVIEYVEGMDLGELLNRRGLLREVEVLDLLRQSLMGLEAAAEKGVIHRDIKPDNLMIGATGTVKVSDFGLAKGYVAEVGVTAAGVRVGTPAFMSPEQCDGSDVDFRSDVYNLGATAYLCVTGQLPFDGETPFAIMLKHKTDPIPSMRDVDPTIDRRMDRLIQRMLAKDPEHRCSSLREMVEEIETLERELAGTDSILRKSRGPFRALVAGEPRSDRIPRRGPPRAPVSVASPDLSVVPPGAAAGVEDFTLQPELPPVPATRGIPSDEDLPGLSDPGSLPLAGPPPTRRLGQGQAATVPTTRRIGSPAGGSPSGSSGLSAVASSGTDHRKRTARQVDTSLVQARERGRRTQIEALIANGDRLAAAGAALSAADEWLSAADMATGDPELQASLRQRAAQVRGAARRHAILRRVALAVAGATVLAMGVRWSVPPLHNASADRRYAVLCEELAGIRERPQQLAALRSFIAVNGNPWPWYTAVFGPPYAISAVASAETQLKELDHAPLASVPVVVPSSGMEGQVAEVLSAAQDRTVPWEVVSKRCAALLGAAKAQGMDRLEAFAPVIGAARTADGELTQERQDFERIEAARTAGDHARALGLVGAFLERHPRAAPSMLAMIPRPVALRLEVLAAALPRDLRVRCDGITVSLDAAERVPATNATILTRVCRFLGSDAVIEVAAAGYLPVRVVVPVAQGEEEKSVSVVLKPAPVWSTAFADPAQTASFVPWANLRRHEGHVLIAHQDGVLLIRPGDGAVVAHLDRPNALSPHFSSLWSPVGVNRLRIGLEDGTVSVYGLPSLIPEQTLLRGGGEILAWTSLDLAMRNGKRIDVVVERLGEGAQVVGREGARAYWRYAAITGVTQKPWLTTHDGRVLIIDDSTVHLIDEDGGVTGTWALPAKRIGAPVVLSAGGGDFLALVSTQGGIQRLTIGRRGDAVILPEPSLAALPPGQIDGEGDSVVIAGEGSLAVARMLPTPLLSWRIDMPGLRTIPPRLIGNQVVVADDRGAVTVCSRISGQVMHRVVHGAPLVARPILMTTGDTTMIVVADRAGQAACYQLR